jgi:hypothetical protein
MNHSPTPLKKLIPLNKKYLRAPRAGQQPQAHLSQSKGASASPVPMEQGGLVETPTGAMTNEELISRAKHHIGTGETARNTSFRAAADDIARACDQGATQRQVAKGVGKSVAWVNRLLQWRKGGYVGAPFADTIVQGVNKDLAPLDPPSIEPASPAVLAETNALALGFQEAANPEAAMAPATKALTAARAASDYHLPQELNRQDPEQAFQRLAKQWGSNPFRDLLLDSPKAAQARFLREVVLPELGGPEAVGLSPSGEGSDQ